MTEMTKSRQHMTPNDIEILIHYHVSPAPHPRISAPAVESATLMLQEHGLIHLVDGSYRTTDRGSAHVQQLCELDFPRAAWVSAAGEVIK